LRAQLETRAIPRQPKLLRLADVRAEMPSSTAQPAPEPSTCGGDEARLHPERDQVPTEAWIAGLMASVGPLDPVIEARKLKATSKRLAAAEGKPWRNPGL
jgi:hypothetical protein